MFLRQCHRLQKRLYHDAARSSPLDYHLPRLSATTLLTGRGGPPSKAWLAPCWEGLRAARLPLDLPPLGQIRFGFT